MKDYYQILEVDKNASVEVIEKAYKVLAMKYHPDKWPQENRKWANAMMQDLNKAYKVLSDERLRKEYNGVPQTLTWDLFLEEGLMGLYNVWKMHR